MPRLVDHQVEFAVFVTVFALVTVLGFAAARWRRPTTIHTLEEWGLGGRAFGNWVTWFLLGGDVYTAYTLVALPALVYAVGAAGFFAVPFAAITYPLFYIVLVRLWSVSHVHGFVTPAEFVRARFGSRGLAALVAVTGIVATMPYIALQLIGIEVVLKAMGVPGSWPLTVAFGVLAVYTANSGLRAPALISIVKDVLLLWTVLAAVLAVAMLSGGWWTVFHAAQVHFDKTPSATDGLLLPATGQLNYLTLVIGSALALFLYPHTLTGVLAARNRATIKRNLAGLPIYTLMLAAVALLGFVAIALGVKPIGGDRNTIVVALFDQTMPAWCAGIAFAAIGVGALVPAAIMSIAAANLFTRNIYREFLRPDASAEEETRVSRIASFTVKVGAVAVIIFVNPQFSLDLQLIGGVIVLQTLPAVAIGLYTRWMHRWALVAGLAAGLVTGIVMLFEIPQLGPGGVVLRAHFGSSAWPLSRFGIDSKQTVYVGAIAVAVNLVVTVAATLFLRAIQVPRGLDLTEPHQYLVDEGDPALDRMTELIDGSDYHPAHSR
jgi:SSS family solute:Na+ symporter